MNTKQLLTKLIAKQNLTQEEALFLVCQMAEGYVVPAQMAAFLVLLSSKGETVDEIAGFIKGMRKYMLFVKSTGTIIDTCGTGGDGMGTFNISTAAAIVVAGSLPAGKQGVKVAKHGNRAISSKCGSADVLEALGVYINLNSKQAEAVLKKVGLVFLFAPLYHPAMKHIAPVRKELGIPTIFNMLGPFLNPAKVKRQIIGVPNISIAKKLAQVGSKLSYKHLMIVSGEDKMDEVSISAKTHIFEIKNKKITTKIIDPSDFGIKKVLQKEIIGGDAKTNAEIILSILQGKKGPYRDIVVLNSAFALKISGKVKSVIEGINLAQRSIDSKKAFSILQYLKKETQKYAQ